MTTPPSPAPGTAAPDPGWGVLAADAGKEAAALATEQRYSQALIGTAAIRDVINAWQLLDRSNVRGSWLAIRTAIMAIISGGHFRSQSLGGLYYQQARAVAKVPGIAGLAPFVPALPPTDLITGTLDATGPWRMLKLIGNGTPVPEASDQAAVNLAGAASRLVVGGGREAVLGTLRRDPEAIAWARITSGSPCAFCAMLASRGAAYKSEGSADFEAHNHCMCSAAPIFRAEDVSSLTSEALAAEWRQATQGLSKGDAVRAFRRYWDAKNSGDTGDGNNGGAS